MLRLPCPSAPVENTHNRVSAAEPTPGNVQSRTVSSIICMCCVTASCSTTFNFLLHAVNGSELRKVLFFALSVYGFFLFVYEIHREPLNGFAPYSHGRRVWSLVWTSLKVEVKGQGHQGQKRHFLALSAACLWSMFGKTSLASSILLVYFMSFVS